MNKKYFWSLLTIMMVAVLGFGFASCDDDDDDNSINSALVGTWTRQVDNIGIIGFKLTADGKAFYNEWSYWEDPDFKEDMPATAKTTSTTLRITHSSMPDYFEEYEYNLSEDGQTLTLTTIDWEEDTHELDGTYTKHK